MPFSLNNSKDIVANGIAVLKGNRTIDVLATIDSLTKIAPDTLHSLEKLAKALNDDCNFFNTITAALSNKADTSTANKLLDAKVDDTELTSYAKKTDTIKSPPWSVEPLRF
jgi:hypothetical protein